MNFDHLSATEFEELCFDLLTHLGYTKLSWRKGTGLSTSPADQGRDIEGFFPQKEADGHVYEQRWFVECKHHRKGVPPESLQPLFTWASAEAPDVVLIIASGFLSNTAKRWLGDYSGGGRVAFKVRVWERKDLERLLVQRTALLRKYRLEPDITFVDTLHPLHLEFIRKPPINTLPFLLAIMDKLEPPERDAWFYGTYICFIMPRAKPPESDDQVLGELLIDTVSYHEFKKACARAARVVDGLLLVRAIVAQALTEAFRAGDITARDEFLRTHQSAIAYFEAELSKAPRKRRAALEGCIRMSRKKLATLESDLAAGRESYLRLCENLLAPLFLEELPRQLQGEVYEESEQSAAPLARDAQTGHSEGERSR